MKNTKLKAIAERAASDLAGLLNDGEEKILEAWREAEEQAGDDEHPKLKLGYTVTLDLDKNHMESVLSFGIKYKLSCDSEIPDPNQVKLPLEEDERPHVTTHPGATIRMKTGGHDTGEIPIEKFNAAIKKVLKKN